MLGILFLFFFIFFPSFTFRSWISSFSVVLNRENSNTYNIISFFFLTPFSHIIMHIVFLHTYLFFLFCVSCCCLFLVYNKFLYFLYIVIIIIIFSRTKYATIIIVFVLYVYILYIDCI